VIVVSDTSPLNYLVLIGHVEKLPILYQRVIIPAAVAEELVHERTPSVVRDFMRQPPAWLRVQSAVETDPTLSELDLGEAQAIALARTMNADLLLCDDAHARDIAKAMQVRVAGTLGVLLEAASFGLLDLEDAVSRLRQTTFRASNALFDQVLAAAQKNPPRQNPPQPNREE